MLESRLAHIQAVVAGPGLAMGILATGIMAMSASSVLQAGNIVDCPVNLAGATPDSGPIVQQGGLVLFDDLQTFEAVVGDGLPLEGFDGGNAPAPGDAADHCPEPINSASDDHCFTPGDLLAGFSLSSTTGGGYVVLGDDHPQVGQDGLAVGPRDIITTQHGNVATIVEFDAEDVTAVSMGVIPGCNGVNVIVQVFNLDDTMIGSTTISTDASWETGFLGLVSPDPVGRITLATNPSGGQLIQDLRFGANPDPVFHDRFEAD